MPKNGIIFIEYDYRGKEVIFAQKKYSEKIIDHPELGKKTFLNCVKAALKNPDEVWPDFSDGKNKRCYYKKYSVNSYAKVVVWITRNPGKVVTAYEIDRIKEKNYPNLCPLK